MNERKYRSYEVIIAKTMLSVDLALSPPVMESSPTSKLLTLFFRFLLYPKTAHSCEHSRTFFP